MLRLRFRSPMLSRWARSLSCARDSQNLRQSEQKEIDQFCEGFHLTRDGCAGTANFRISGTSQYLHVMWSSPNNFDKHASHLAIGKDWQTSGVSEAMLEGVGPERCDKFHDMYYQRPTWFARKYVYHDTHGVWYHSPELVIHAKSTTR